MDLRQKFLFKENMMNEGMIQALLQEASSRILEGVSLQERPGVSAEFEHLLSLHLGKANLSSSPENDPEALRSGRVLIEEIGNVPSENRLERIQRELLIAEMSNLDASAWETAEKSLKGSADLPVLRMQARAILNEIDQLLRALNKEHPAWEQDYARSLTEAAGDCLFVLGESPYNSFRLGRTIRIMQAMGHWPPAWYEDVWSQKNARVP